MGENVRTRKVKEDVVEARVNPLRNERIFVRFVPQASSLAGNDPRHVASGGMMEGSSVTFCVPMLRTGQYKNVLTNNEKDYLEEALGLDFNALSVYNKGGKNYWDDYFIRITKEGLHLDLSNPEDYIRYKVLLANKEVVAPSVQERIDRPKNTYRFEIVREDEETNMENAKMDATMQCYKEFGKIEDDIDTLRVLVELLDSRPYSATEKSEFLKSRLNILIQSNPKSVLKQMTDPMLHTKMLIRRGVELGTLTKRGDYYYLKSDNSPLCDSGEDPTLSIAARYLNQPLHQDIKFILESAVGNNKKK